ncbi:MAG: DUF481 domain-containing protein [Gemmatimonadota bacterium]
MPRFYRLTILAVLLIGLALSFTPSSLVAQAGVAELGVDGGVTIRWPEGGERTLTLSAPFTSFRVTNHVSDHFALETQAGVLGVDDGDQFVVAGTVDLRGQFHFSPGALRPRGYLFGGGSWLWANANEFVSQFVVGGGLGYKFPVRRTIGVRLEVGYGYGFENEDFTSGHSLQFALGLSTFLGIDRATSPEPVTGGDVPDVPTPPAAAGEAVRVQIQLSEEGPWHPGELLADGRVRLRGQLRVGPGDVVWLLTPDHEAPAPYVVARRVIETVDAWTTWTLLTIEGR